MRTEHWHLHLKGRTPKKIILGWKKLTFSLSHWFSRITTMFFFFFQMCLSGLFYRMCFVKHKIAQDTGLLGYVTGWENCLSVLTQGHRYFLVFLHLDLDRFPQPTSAFLFHSCLPFLSIWNQDVDFFQVLLISFLCFVSFLLLLKWLINLKISRDENMGIKPCYHKQNEAQFIGLNFGKWKMNSRKLIK